MVFLLQHLLEESARQHPERKAVIFDGRSICYRELEETSNKLANVLLSLGVSRGDRVGIFMPKMINSIVSVFGIMKAGGVYVPIAPDAPVKRIEYILNNCGIKHLITTEKRIEILRQVFDNGCPVGKIILADTTCKIDEIPFENVKWSTILNSSDTEPPQPHLIDRDLAYILYTSGSTGDPKGVMLSHLNSLTFVNWAQHFFHIGKEDRVASFAPLHFDLSVFDIFSTIKAGGTVVLIPDGMATFPFKLAELIEKEEITIWNSVPSVLVLLVTHGKMERFKYPHLRLVLFAGEKFPLKFLRQLKNLVPHADFYNQYGQTEANSSTCYHIQQIPDESGQIPIGKAAANFEVFALDEEKRLITQPGQIGELYVRGSAVAQGYWGDVEKTSAAFVKNPLRNESIDIVYKTNDLVTLDKEGNYIFLCRKDNMIKSRGYRIELGEIEAVISRHPAVKQVAAIAIPDDLIGNRIKACVVPTNPDILTAPEIKKHCYAALPGYMIPEIIEFYQRLPMTSTGKTDKRQLTLESISNMKVEASINDCGKRT